VIVAMTREAAKSRSTLRVQEVISFIGAGVKRCGRIKPFFFQLSQGLF
jgi:hypothetical protein